MKIEAKNNSLSISEQLSIKKILITPVVGDSLGETVELDMSKVNTSGTQDITQGSNLNMSFSGVFNAFHLFVDEDAQALVENSLTGRFDGVNMYQKYDENDEHLVYQNTDNVFLTEVTDQATGNVLDANQFFDAEYIIARRSKVIVRKTLNDGIAVVNGVFITKVDDDEITVKEGDGYTHQFVVFDDQGNKRPPVFNRPVSIVKVVA